MSLYSSHPGFAREAAFIANLHERTGKTLEQWMAEITKSGPPTLKERIAWLKADRGLTRDYATWLAGLADGSVGAENYEPDALVDSMFAAKESLRPIYDKLLQLGLALGKDVKACPCKTIVPLYRRHVFAQIKPASKTRIDFGFALHDTKPTARLLDTGGFAKKDRITHRIAISTPADIDEEVKSWLKKAYQLDA